MGIIRIIFENISTGTIISTRKILIPRKFMLVLASQLSVRSRLALISTGHCIDNLRQVLMCHADISLLTYTWRDDYGRPWPNFNIQHECRNWDAIVQWTDERRGVLNRNTYQHPKFGPFNPPHVLLVATTADSTSKGPVEDWHGSTPTSRNDSHEII